MDLPSVAWDWNKVDDEFWMTPSEEAYYLRDRWKKHGFKKILDLGCGLGQHSVFFRNNGFEVAAFDLSSDGIDKWRTQAIELDLEVTVGDMRDLPYSDASFDCVFAMHTIYHADTVAIRKVISEIWRVMKPNGEFFASMCSKATPKFKNGAYRTVDACTVVKNEPPEKDVPHYYVNLNDLLELFPRFNLKNIRHVEECLYNGRDPNISWHYFILGAK